MNWRFNASLVLFLLFFACILARLFYWQVVRAEELSSLGESQYGRQIKMSPLRGEIRTSDGFPVAANKLSYLVFANPKEIAEKEKSASLLSLQLGIDQATISAFLSQNRFWVALGSHVDVKTKESIEKLSIKGVGFEEQSIRLYPEASTAAKLLGFVGKDEKGEDTGYFGLEGYYDRQLRGKSGLAHQIYDALGRPILAKMTEKKGEVQGRSLILHIDRPIQYMLEKELQKGIEKYGARAGMAAVMDPKTGGILAISSFPSYDPSEYQKYSGNFYRDSFISDTYEPGSTFKPLVMASAIDSNLVTPATRCTICDGPVEIGGYKIQTWNNKYLADLTMMEVIQHSDNIGMVFVAQKLGLDRMLRYLDRFGIGQLTRIDLQGEVTPELRPRDSWYPIDLATASFGQGISVTPIELLSAFSAIANDGKRMEPHVVAAVETEDGERIDVKPRIVNQPISSKTAKIMTEILVNAVDKGEAKFAKPKGYRIAGKTGTAQIPVAGHYDPKETISSFIGFAPAEDPKFIAIVIYDRPTSSIYGAETAAPTFFTIAKNILMYYGISPTEAENN